jgi:hypothetical protein
VDFLIAMDDLHDCRFAEGEPAQPADGQALLSVDCFGLTANNITYAKFGEAMSYWDFFPAAEGWGRMPVWGFAEVIDSRVEGVEPGARLYGYLPPSTELLVAPRVSAQGFADASPHRQALPAAYNGYVSTDADPVYDKRTEDRQMLLRPLFYTSWLLDDFLNEQNMFGAGMAVLSSASSRTASALAYLLSLRGGVEVVGLTSPRSRRFAESLEVYDRVVCYEELEELPSGPSVYVDMSGDAGVRTGVHRHYGGDLAHSAVVGATHHDRMGKVPRELPGPRPAFFFAPDRVAKRAGDWGRAGLEGRLADSWHPYVTWTESWLRVIHERGQPALRSAYLDLLDGRIDPGSAHVLTLA